MRELNKSEKKEMKEFLKKEMEEMSLTIKKLDSEKQKLHRNYMKLSLLLSTIEEENEK